MKKYISIILSLCLVICTVSLGSFEAFADDTIHTSQDGLWKYRILDNNTAEITNDWECAYLGSDSIVTIPDTIDGYTVTSLGLYSFVQQDTVTQINIGDNITNYERAFVMCTALESINVSANNPCFNSVDGVLFSEDMKTIFCYPCANTRSSYSVPDGVTTVMFDAFVTCFNLESIILPDSVTTIYDEAFAMCTSLESIVIPDGVRSLMISCFYGCENLSSVTLPDTLTSILENAFGGCTSLTEISIPRNVTNIDSYAFDESGLTTVRGYLGTVAETFATNNNLTFIPLNNIIAGDLNGDEQLSIADYNLYLNYISGLSTDLDSRQLLVADIDGDGAIDAFDLFKLDLIINGHA